jgi:primosomal protein N' (replication factor Y)
VVIQTYWPDHPAVRAVALGRPELLYEPERADRHTLRFPPYGRLVNIVISGPDSVKVRDEARLIADALRRHAPAGWEVVGPSSAPIARLKGNWRWHLLLKTPPEADVSSVLHSALAEAPGTPRVTRVVDVDPIGMM